MEKFNSIGKHHRSYVTVFVIILVICCIGAISFASMNPPDPININGSCRFESSAYSEKKIERDFLPVSIPEVDIAPWFESVHLSKAACLSEKICFTGVVKDDIRLKKVSIIVRAPTGSYAEIVKEPIPGRSLDLSEFCIDGINDLVTEKQGDYEIILTARDSAGQVVSKNFYLSSFSLTGCQQDMYGGQCVSYVRNFFGGRYDQMPGLCIYADCGAYHAWDEWDLGFGRGRIPAKNSILIMDQGRLLYGHVAVVLDHKRNADGTYTLTVNESNWDQDELIDCKVRYTYFPETSEIQREGRTKIYDVAGFIYSDNRHLQQDVPPEYDHVALPDSVKYPEKAYFMGYAKDDVGLKEVRIEVSGPKGNQLPVIHKKVSGLRKDLSDLWFDSNNREYAGVEGSYTVKLIIVDIMDQQQIRTFSVQVNGVN